MEIRTVPICDLRPAPYNPRVQLKAGDPGYERLKRSLREFDLVQPIVWNERTGHVVGGHQRLQVLQDDGATEVQVSVVSLPLEREKALNVALNNARVGGDWDIDKLGELLGELCELPDFDETLTGFDERDLRDLLFVPAEVEDDQESERGTRVILDVPADRWDLVRPDLEQLVDEHHLDMRVVEADTSRSLTTKAPRTPR